MNLPKLKRSRRAAQPIHVVRYMVFLCILSLSLFILWTEQFSKVKYAFHGQTKFQLGNLRAGWSALFGLTVLESTLAVMLAFGTPSKRLRLCTIICYYFAMIFIFSGFYYALASVGDFGDASEATSFYSDPVILSAPEVRSWSIRAFRGIEERLWDGPEQLARNPLQLRSGAMATSQQIAAFVKEHPLDETVQFRPDRRFRVYLQCLHVSVMTMTTVGFGDVSPACIDARAATDLQALLGVILLVVGLGVALGMPPEQRHRKGMTRGLLSNRDRPKMFGRGR